MQKLLLSILLSLPLHVMAKAPAVDVKNLREDALKTLTVEIPALRLENLGPSTLWFQDAASDLANYFISDGASFIFLSKLPAEFNLTADTQVAVVYGLNGLKGTYYARKTLERIEWYPNVVVIDLVKDIQMDPEFVERDIDKRKLLQIIMNDSTNEPSPNTDNGDDVFDLLDFERLKTDKEIVDRIKKLFPKAQVEYNPIVGAAAVAVDNLLEFKRLYTHLKQDQRIDQIIFPTAFIEPAQIDRPKFLGDGLQSQLIEEPDRLRKITRELAIEGYLPLTKSSLPAPFGEGVIMAQVKVQLVITLNAASTKLDIEKVAYELSLLGLEVTETLSSVGVIYALTDNAEHIEASKKVKGVMSVEVMK